MAKHHYKAAYNCHMGKEVIATDIDEVLFPFVNEFLAWHNQEYGTSLMMENFQSYNFEDTLEVPVAETVHRVNTFLNIAHDPVLPLEQSQQGITALSKRYKLVAITARHPRFEHSTWRYIDKYYHDKIAELTLVGHRETVDTVKKKVEICLNIGAMALIDDNIEHITPCPDMGVEGVLFGNYPWNQQESIQPGVVRCHDWLMVMEHFGV